MALLYSDEEEADRLEAYLSLRPHYLLKGETLGLYQQRLQRQKSTNKVARMALNMLLILAISSDYERVFSQAKLLITGQRYKLKLNIIEATQCLKAQLIIDRKRIRSQQGKGNWKVPHEISTRSWEQPQFCLFRLSRFFTILSFLLLFLVLIFLPLPDSSSF